MSNLASDVIQEVQDSQSLRASLLVIQEALESGKWPMSFIIYNDSWIDDVMKHIACIMSEKYNIEVPASTLET